MIDTRILICAAASVLGHFVIAEALQLLPDRPKPVIDRTVEVRVVMVPPPDPEPPPPEPPKPVEPAVVETPQPVAKPTRVKATVVHDAIPKDVPVAPNAVVATEAPAQPVYGVTMESTSQGGKGPSVPIGNTTTPQPAATPGTAVKPLGGAPVAGYEVTKMPLPLGRCSGKYTDAARAAALEGTVVLDLVVDERGRAREITVVEGLAHGLTEAAIVALKTCTFTPGEKAGQPVSVRVRGFKIRFVMQDAR
ncbi:MAG: energy transducer TonB [Kofleriaceae bacterium]